MDTDQVVNPNFNPADLVDPNQQRKVAENVLQQLGLHPNQMGARNLLDLHFQGPTANPELAESIKPLINSQPNQSIAPPAASAPVNDKTSVTPPVVPQNQPTTPQEPANNSTSAPLVNPGTPTIPTPSRAARMTDNRTVEDEGELNRLIRTGSGISQIRNPFLRGLATVGDVAGASLFPRVEGLIPGTEGHHEQLVAGRQNLINTDIGRQTQEAKNQLTEQQTQNAATESQRNPNELSVWMRQNPNRPISEYWTQKAAAEGNKRTPQEMAMIYYTTPKEEGGAGMTPADALIQTEKDIAGAKPPTSAQQEATFQQTVAKLLKGGQMSPQMMTDPKAVTDAINNSANLTPQEKAAANAYLATKTTPASQASVANIRNSAIMNRSLTPVIDRNSGMLTLITPGEFQKNPDGYIPATQGQQAMTKESVFSDIHFNSKLTRDAMNNLQNGFSAGQRAQISMTLSSSDPAKAWDSFWHSSVAETLTPDQVDYVTALAALQENAMAMRSIQGLGQGSDEMRAAIRQMLPGASTPTKDFGNRQMDIFDGVVNRLETGVPKTGIPKPNFGQPAKTGQEGSPATEMPPDSVLKTTAEGQYATSPDKKHTFQKVNGQWKEYKGVQ